MEVPRKNIVVVRTTKREVILGIVTAVAVLAFVGFAIYSLTKNMSGGSLTGTITAKNFTPQPEQQISIGKAGLHERKVAGIYTFEVYVDSEKKTFTVWVDPTVFDAHKVGDRFYFLRPPPESR